MGTSRHGGMLMPDETEPKNGATPIHTEKGKAPAPKTEEGEALEGADPSDVLPEDPDEQNDLA